MAWAEMADFGAVRRHKDGRTFIELPADRGQKRRIWSLPLPGGSMAWTRESATRALELIRARIAQGATIDEAIAVFLPANHSVNLLLSRAEQWLAVKWRDAEAGDRSPTYVRELERYLRRDGHFSWWAGWSIHEVSYAALEDWSHWLADRGLSPKTRWNVLAAFRSFLGWLYKREEIRELPREFPWPRPTENAPPVLSPRTQEEILLAIPEERRGIYLALALMGLRPGEAVALDVSDYRDGWLTVNKARKGDRLDAPIRSTKTGKPKRLPVAVELQEWIERRDPSPGPLVRDEPPAHLDGGLRSRRREGEPLRGDEAQLCDRRGCPRRLGAGPPDLPRPRGRALHAALRAARQPGADRGPAAGKRCGGGAGPKSARKTAAISAG
jgi:integrase